MKNKVLDIIIRYTLAIILSLNSLYIFYLVFKPLTVYPIVFILNIFYDVSFFSLNNITVSGNNISFVNACIAGSAYYLLALLNLSTASISFKNRTKIFIIDSASLLCFNIIRIVFLAVLLVNFSAVFDTVHYVLWHFVSIIFVAGIWIFTIKHYKIKSIPIYSDVLFLINQIKGKKKECS